KGFAVVADEVKRLAKKVSDFIEEIEKITGELEGVVRDTVQKVKESNKMVDEVEEATSVIAGAVEEQTAVVNGIVENTSQAKEKSFAFVSNIEDLNKVVEKLSKTISHLEVGSSVIEEIAHTVGGISHIVELSERAITDEELQKMATVAITKAGIIGHINWKIGFLKDALSGRIPKVERDHRRCLLGRTLPYLKQRLANTPLRSIIEALDAPHEKLHGLVEKFEREVNISNKDEVLEFIRKEVLPTFEKVIKLLEEILEGCKKYKCE
ncbi:MAG: methyl-accepting chemotaxis protein, partial [Caldimicrobium sp.]